MNSVSVRLLQWLEKDKGKQIAFIPLMNMQLKRYFRVGKFCLTFKKAPQPGQSKEEEKDDETQPSTFIPKADSSDFQLGKKEVLMTMQDAQVRTRKLPKGYAYVPVVPQPPKPQAAGLPRKRERKKIAHDDYVEPVMSNQMVSALSHISRFFQLSKLSVQASET